MNQKTLEDVIKTVRVSVVADVCGVSQRAIYKWMDNAECNARGVTKSAIDRITFMAGFADALIQVGWLVETNGVLSLPNFERHNGKSSKKRAVTNERVTKIRELKRKGNAASVTKTDQKALPEEEKEEDINTYLPLNPPRQKRASKKFEPEAIELPDWLPETLWHEWVQFRQTADELATFFGITSRKVASTLAMAISKGRLIRVNQNGKFRYCMPGDNLPAEPKAASVAETDGKAFPQPAGVALPVQEAATQEDIKTETVADIVQSLPSFTETQADDLVLPSLHMANRELRRAKNHVQKWERVCAALRELNKHRDIVRQIVDSSSRIVSEK
ncbi:Phage protein [Escherichia coli]